MRKYFSPVSDKEYLKYYKNPLQLKSKTNTYIHPRCSTSPIRGKHKNKITMRYLLTTTIMSIAVIYLLIWRGDRGREINQSSSSNSLPKRAQQLGQSQEPRTLRVPHGWQEPKLSNYGTKHFPGTWAGSQIGSGVAWIWFSTLRRWHQK